MSIEQVLPIVAVLVLLLVQFLSRIARQQHGHEPVQAQSLPPSPQQPPMPELQPPRDTEDGTLSDAMTTPERKPARSADRPVAPPIPRATRRGASVVGLRDPLDLRRAIVLITVLDPCRAIHPHD